MHKQGKLNQADYLPQRPDHGRGVNNNKSITLLKDHHFRVFDPNFKLSNYSVVFPEIIEEELDFQSLNSISSFPETIKSKIMESQRYQEKYTIKDLERKLKEWTLDNGILKWNGRLYVPKKQDLQERIIQEHHNAITAGHPGMQHTKEFIKQKYWWPNIAWDVKCYVSGCKI